MKKFLKYPILFSIGGFTYYMIEIISRGFSHWSMFILGGLCFVIIGSLNEILGRKTTLFPQMLLGAGIITLLEYIRLFKYCDYDNHSYIRRLHMGQQFFF